MATKPDPNTPATFYQSVEQLCDDVGGIFAQLAALQVTMGNVQGAVGAEAQARSQAIAAEAQARSSSDAAEAQTRSQGLASEASARVAAIQQEQQARGVAISAAIQSLTDQIGSLGDSLRDALRAETRARTSADDGEQQARVDAIRAQAKALADAVADLEEQIGAKASTDALTKAIGAIRVVTETISTTIIAQRLDFIACPGRPGDAPLRYTFVAAAAALAGGRAALPLIPAEMLAGTENGTVVRVDGAGIVAGRAACPLEPGRLYRSRYVIQRRANPADPSGDAALCGLVFLDQSLRVLGDVVTIRAYPELATAFGRQECEALIARTAGLGEAFVAPARARFMVPVVATFGPDAVTDVEVLDLEDVTGSFVLAPPPDGIEARLQQMIADLVARVQVLESAAGTPGRLTFGSRGDAASATIPESVQIVELLGRRYLGDGGAGLFVRITGDPADGAETFTSHGAVFQRVRPLPDVAATVVDAGFEAFMADLPTSIPDGSGGRWNNGGFPTVSRGVAP